MILGIDASNIRTGGGLSHLKQLLKFSNPIEHGFTKVIIWSNKETLQSLPNHHWLIKETHPYLNKSSAWSFIFQIFVLKQKAKKQNCSMLFVPGGTFINSFVPFVTMCQNMLPFELHEAFRFKRMGARLRFLVLRLTQSYTFKRANGIIFLTAYAQKTIENKIALHKPEKIIIPHGINTEFSMDLKDRKPAILHSRQNPFKLLYVSIVTVYKHQWNVAEAVCKLYNDGLPIELTLIGPRDKEGFDKLQEVLDNCDSSSKCINYLGKIDHEKLFQYYKTADGFVFASSCENMPLILIEAMTAGLPIACSNKGPMPEVLGDAGIYFNPEKVDEIYAALKELFLNEHKRTELANSAFHRIRHYTWENCASDTFAFFAQVATTEK